MNEKVKKIKLNINKDDLTVADDMPDISIDKKDGNIFCKLNKSEICGINIPDNRQQSVIEFSLEERRNSEFYIENLQLLRQLAQLEKKRTDILNKLYHNEFIAQYAQEEYNIEDFKVTNIDVINTYMRTIRYIQGNLIKIQTNLLPANLFAMTTTRNYTENKNTIKFFLMKALQQYKEKWEQIVITYELFYPIIFDVDNYFFKPYTDAICESGIIKDDTCDKVKIVMIGSKSKDNILNITIENAKV